MAYSRAHPTPAPTPFTHKLNTSPFTDGVTAAVPRLGFRVAYVFDVSQVDALPDTDASIEYIQSYRGTPDTVDAPLERIRLTAQRLSTELTAIRFNAEHDPGPR